MNRKAHEARRSANSRARKSASRDSSISSVQSHLLRRISPISIRIACIDSPFLYLHLFHRPALHWVPVWSHVQRACAKHLQILLLPPIFRRTRSLFIPEPFCQLHFQPNAMPVVGERPAPLLLTCDHMPLFRLLERAIIAACCKSP